MSVELPVGGMSRLFVARERSLGRQVVVKVLPPDQSAPVSIERFRREAEVLAALQHTHIVPLLGFGAADDLLYYTMPFVRGESLRERLERDGMLPVDEGIALLRELADAVAYAHRQGVIHRDIKPANVLLAEGHAVLSDFGISRPRNATAARLTTSGISVGTLGYKAMAPDPARRFATASDFRDALGETGKGPGRRRTPFYMMAAAVGGRMLVGLLRRVRRPDR